MKEYWSIKQPTKEEFTEKRSRFIGRAYPVSSEEEALAYVNAVKKECHDARHNVYAFVLKDGLCRYSEDGEPQGTAGVPVLNVIQKNQLEDCLIVVTRYFGGILLGTGGLTRAYSHAAALAVEASQTVQMKVCKVMQLSCDYASYQYIETLITTKGIMISSDFGEQVQLKFAVLPNEVDSIQKQITEYSAGALQMKEIEEQIFPFEKKN